MKNPIIIGIGSPFGIDRLGWDVIDYLENHKPHAIKHSQLVKLDRPATELLSWLDIDKQIIIIDAIDGNGARGKVVRLEMNDIPDSNKKLSSHGVGLSDALQLADALGQLPEDLLIIGLETGGNINGSPEHEHIKEITDQILKEVGLVEYIKLQ